MARHVAPMSLTTVDTKSDSSSYVPHFFKAIFFIFFAVVVIRVLTNRGAITFTGFLNYLAKSPAVSFDWISSLQPTNFGETFPYGFGWLGSAIDFFSSIFIGLCWGAEALAKIIVFIVWALRFIFLA